MQCETLEEYMSSLAAGGKKATEARFHAAETLNVSPTTMWRIMKRKHAVVVTGADGKQALFIPAAK